MTPPTSPGRTAGVTYQQNLTDPDDIARAIASLAEQVVKDIAAEGRPCPQVHLKVRFAPFFTVARNGWQSPC